MSLSFARQDDDVETIKEAFKIFDRDKDGFISTKELKKVGWDVQQCFFCKSDYIWEFTSKKKMKNMIA